GVAHSRDARCDRARRARPGRRREPRNRHPRPSRGAPAGVPPPSGRRLAMSLSPITDAVEALRAGRPIIVADDENRENEGDIIISAELATPEVMAWMVRWTSGLICAPMPADLADSLNLPPMVESNEDARSTAYTVSVDAADGVTTG